MSFFISFSYAGSKLEHRVNKHFEFNTPFRLTKFSSLLFYRSLHNEQILRFSIRVLIVYES